MCYTVSFAPEVEAQLLSLYRYIAGKASPEIADRYLGAIVEHCEKSKDFAQRGTPRDDIRLGLRTTPFKRRVIIAYAVTNDRVIMLGIYYGGQDFATLLG